MLVCGVYVLCFWCGRARVFFAMRCVRVFCLRVIVWSCRCSFIV